MKQSLTNEQRLRKLINMNHSMLNALLVERLLTIAQLTKDGIEQHPEMFDNPFVSHKTYSLLIENIEQVFDTKF